MKFLVITAIKAYEYDVKHILKSCQISTFSFHQISGYKNNADTEDIPHWFAGDERRTTQSFMFYVIATEAMIVKVVDKINKTNFMKDFESKIHFVSLDVEQSNIK